MPPARPERQDAAGVADGQAADAAFCGPADYFLGRFVLGLADPALVPSFSPTLAAPVLSPPPRSLLARTGSPPRDGATAGGGVFEVLVVLGADGPPGHQEALRVGPSDRVEVDDAQVDSRHPGRIGLLLAGIHRDRDFGGHIDRQPPRVTDQRDRADLLWRVWQIPV
jgi:hypothetical protein